MELFGTISDLIAVGGVTGNENAVGETVTELFKRFTGDVWRDTSGNVYARMGNGKPVILSSNS
jgi:putative aminopeptidase FrvX